MVTELARTVALGSAGNFWAARGDSDRAGHLGQAFVVGRGFRRAAVGKPALGHDSPDSVHNRGHDLRGGPLTGPYLGAVSSTAGRPHYHRITCKPLSPPRTSIVQRVSCTATKLTGCCRLWVDAVEKVSKMKLWN